MFDRKNNNNNLWNFLVHYVCPEICAWETTLTLTATSVGWMPSLYLFIIFSGNKNFFAIRNFSKSSTHDKKKIKNSRKAQAKSWDDTWRPRGGGSGGASRIPTKRAVHRNHIDPGVWCPTNKKFEINKVWNYYSHFFISKP